MDENNQRNCPHTPADQEWKCPKCGEYNNIRLKQCKSCYTKQPHFWWCPRCHAANTKTEKYCCNCGTKKPINTIGILSCVVLLLLAFQIYGAVSRNRQPVYDQTSSVATPSVTLAPTAPIPIQTIEPEKKTLPNQGLSTAGTQLFNIIYNSDGKILTCIEKANGTIYSWTYEYSGDSFVRRTRWEEAPKLSWARSPMPGSDILYSTLSTSVYNCVGFVMEYCVSNVLSGTALGDRYLYIGNGDLTKQENWYAIDTFSYSDFGTYQYEFYFPRPVVLAAFATPRMNPDDSHFAVNQKLLRVCIADYDEVVLQ